MGKLRNAYLSLYLADDSRARGAVLIVRIGFSLNGPVRCSPHRPSQSVCKQVILLIEARFCVYRLKKKFSRKSNAQRFELPYSYILSNVHRAHALAMQTSHSHEWAPIVISRSSEGHTSGFFITKRCTLRYSPPCAYSRNAFRRDIIRGQGSCSGGFVCCEWRKVTLCVSYRCLYRFVVAKFEGPRLCLNNLISFPVYITYTILFLWIVIVTVYT